MCKAKPAGRCSYHARKILLAAQEEEKRVGEARIEAFSRKPSVEVREEWDAKYAAAVRKRNAALEDFYETPDGQAQLQKHIDRWKAEGPSFTGKSARIAAQYQSIKDAALRRHEEKEELYRQAHGEKDAEGGNSTSTSQDAGIQNLGDSSSDTDEAVLRLTDGVRERLHEAKEKIAANGGKAEFSALFDLEGNLVPAKYVNTMYGYSWGVLSDPDDPYSGFTEWINESKSENPAYRAVDLEAKGYRVGTVKVPAAVKLDSPDDAASLSDAFTVYVNTFRTDGGFSQDAEIVSNGT